MTPQLVLFIKRNSLGHKKYLSTRSCNEYGYIFIGNTSALVVHYLGQS